MFLPRRCGHGLMIVIRRTSTRVRPELERDAGPLLPANRADTNQAGIIAGAECNVAVVTLLFLIPRRSLEGALPSGTVRVVIIVIVHVFSMKDCRSFHVPGFGYSPGFNSAPG